MRWNGGTDTRTLWSVLARACVCTHSVCARVCMALWVRVRARTRVRARAHACVCLRGWRCVCVEGGGGGDIEYHKFAEGVGLA